MKLLQKRECRARDGGRGEGRGGELRVLHVRVELLACRALKGSIIIGRRGDGREPLRRLCLTVFIAAWWAVREALTAT